MPTTNGMGSVFRNPPMVFGQKVYMANEVDDIVDWGLTAHGIPEQWAKKGGKGKSIIVGVADTGKPVHDDLEDAVIASRNFSTSWTDEDTQGHATHVCGTIAARDNGKGVIGVAPECKLITAKVLGDDGSGSNLSVAQGVRYLHEQGCHVINMSLGGPFDTQIAKEVEAAVNDGIFVICAIGNEGQAPGQDRGGYPGRLPFTVAVASYNKAGSLSRFSSGSSGTHIAFPGEDILSTWPNGTYRRISGTSMATPFCAGVVALMLSQGKKKGAELPKDNRELITLLKSHAVDQGPVGRDDGWGWGIVDVPKFLELNGEFDNGEEEPADPDEIKEIDLLFGFVKMRTPVTIDGQTGLFVFLS